MFAIGFCVEGPYQIKEVSSPNFLSNFYYKWVLDFVRHLFVILKQSRFSFSLVNYTE